MRITVRRVALLTGLAVGVAGCGGVTTFEDPVGTLEVAAGEEFRIELGENPSTGYVWRFVRRPDPAVARVLGSSFELEEGGEDRDGAGGTRILRLRAGDGGETTMSLVKEFSGGEPGRRPTDTQQLVVKVE